jgi:hypothetical protein
MKAAPVARDAESKPPDSTAAAAIDVMIAMRPETVVPVVATTVAFATALISVTSSRPSPRGTLRRNAPHTRSAGRRAPIAGADDAGGRRDDERGGGSAPGANCFHRHRHHHRSGREQSEGGRIRLDR